MSEIKLYVFYDLTYKMHVFGKGRMECSAMKTVFYIKEKDNGYCVITFQ